MKHHIELLVSPEQLFNKDVLKLIIAKTLNIDLDSVNDFKILKQSIDARKDVKYNLKIAVATDKDYISEDLIEFKFQEVTEYSKKIIIVGAGPAGYFAALKALMQGFKPIVIERGKTVEERKYDIAAINRGNKLNPESNFAFGEGGAGTYSDGKLYTRSKKRGSVKEVLELLVFFGANRNILTDAHPHIGTDKISSIIRNIRNTLIQNGGEIHFNTKVNELLLKDGRITGVKTQDNKEFNSKYVILATGHSARDVYEFLSRKNIKMESKGFAMGLRIEHPQALINEIQYKKFAENKYLPPAIYSVSKQINGRGVYSFCMCPGGIIVPATTSAYECVVNGMSNSRRNSGFANAGIVVELRKEDFLSYENNGLFSGLEFQKKLENLAHINSGIGLTAPAQRVSDFVKGKISTELPKSSYNPGLISSPMHFWLPKTIGERIRHGLIEFNKSMRGFITEEAIVVGVESRTSSPVQIVRDRLSGEHVSTPGLFPCGEGAGYAGGIVSAAIDGMNAVENIYQRN